MNIKLPLVIQLSAGLLSLSLLGCQPQNNEEPQRVPIPPSDEVVLGPESPKRQYIQEAVAEPVQRPLMDPVTGKITYDEVRTARVSSPIAGRVIGAIAALGTSVRAGDTLAVLDSPDLGEAQSAYAAAVADLNLADRNFQRVRELYDNG